MSQILTALISIINITINKYINTGDRNLDNALIFLSTILINSLVNIILNTDYKIIYNIILYYVFYFFKDVNDPSKLPYLHINSDFFGTGPGVAKKMEIVIDDTNKFKEFIKYKKYDIIWKDRRCDVYGMVNNIEFFSIYVYYGYIVYGTIMIKPQSGLKGSLVLYSKIEYPIAKALIKIMEEYNKFIDQCPNVMNSKKIYYIRDDKINELGDISRNKVFNTLFYDQKDDLINLLTKFKNNNLYPKCISMDNKLGILLYGPPGTGKTGTISAIANMLDRNILLINFSEITTCLQLDFVLSKSNRDNILVFDEFDCILDALVNPNKISIEPDNTNSKWSELLTVAEGEERKEILKMIKENKNPTKNTPLDLGYLLSKLDGLEDNNGRIIIATTNNPEKINPTLLRPGRFDIKLCLQNCSKQMYKDIIGNYFCNKEINVDNIPERKYSPLEVINTCLVQNDLVKVLANLK